MADFEAELWLYPGDVGWCFLTLPLDLSDDLQEQTDGRRAGFGSIRVDVRVGATSWSTSLFPDKATGAYLLPVKKPVRLAEELEVGDLVAVELTVAG